MIGKDVLRTQAQIVKTQLETDPFTQRMLRVYEDSKTQIGYQANRYRRKVLKDGGVAAAKYWLRPSASTTEGFTRLLARWKKPYPFTLAQAGGLARKTEPNAQDILLISMCAPGHLLDILRNFVVFERDVHSGRVVKKLPRYQQFIAVRQAVLRSLRDRSPEERGGVVWHTQGSGKSLTMLWLAQRLRREPFHQNPTLVLVTDWRDLDEQITQTFLACGFPNPVRAESIRELREMLQGPSGSTVMTTVQKFQEIGGVSAALASASRSHGIRC
jgi:type I site-specific restriction-modification system R (restriction) subunit